MSRKSEQRGQGTSVVEVTNVSKHGFWLILDGTERFLALELFPWFREATIGQITDVELVTPGHLRWPSMDIDLALDSIDRPDEYPLVSKATTSAKG